MSSEYSQFKVDEAKRYLVDYLKTDKLIDQTEKKLSEPLLNPENTNQFQQQLAELKEQQREIAVVFKYEHKINIQQELESGRSPLQIMQDIRKQFPEREPERQPVHPDRPFEKEKLPEPFEGSHKLEEQRHGERKTPEPESKPLTERTFTVTHQREVPESEYEDLYKNPPHHPRSSSRKRGRDNT